MTVTSCVLLISTLAHLYIKDFFTSAIVNHRKFYSLIRKVIPGLKNLAINFLYNTSDVKNICQGFWHLWKEFAKLRPRILIRYCHQWITSWLPVVITFSKEIAFWQALNQRLNQRLQIICSEIRSYAVRYDRICSKHSSLKQCILGREGFNWEFSTLSNWLIVWVGTVSLLLLRARPAILSFS